MLKCEFYGFRGKTNARLRSYLSDRYQRVLINNSSSNNTTFSEWGKIKHSIPQGSILGPLFFLHYINDLPNITADPSKLVLLAHDTSIIITNPSPQISFRSKNSYEINTKISCDKLVKETKNSKFIGIDSFLSWKDDNDQMLKLGRANFLLSIKVSSIDLYYEFYVWWLRTAGN